MFRGINKERTSIINSSNWGKNFMSVWKSKGNYGGKTAWTLNEKANWKSEGNYGKFIKGLKCKDKLAIKNKGQLNT